MKQIVLRLLELYQTWLSPDHGVFAYRHPHGFCKYYPSCSEYAKESVKKHGVVGGCFRGLIRVLRCNPFSKGGYDPA